MTDRIEVSGATAPSGRQYVSIRKGAAEAWVPIESCTFRDRTALQSLAERGIRIFTKRDEDDLIEKISAISSFPSANIVEEVGWNGLIYAMADGTIFSADEDRQRHVAFPIKNRKCAVAGKFSTWKKNVAEPLAGQSLATFVMMLAFAAPLLRMLSRVDNFGFELVGKKGIGKSTLQYLMSSILGGATHGRDGHYWISLNTTLNAVEAEMIGHNDHPVIFDEANLLAAGETSKKFGEIYSGFAFKLGSGDHKSRHGEPKRDDFRYVFLVSANQSLLELASESSKQAQAANDRLMTIRIPPDWPYRVYQFLPEGFADGVEYASTLIKAANDNHGHAFRKFMARLVRDRAEDEACLVDRLEAHISEFLKKAGANRNEGSDHRVAEAFAIVYAAGRLAKAYKVLPDRFKCGEAALSCFRLCVAENATHTPFADRLEALANHKDVVTITKRADTLEQAERAKSALAVLYIKPSHREIRIPPSKIYRAFPDWDRLKKEKEVQRFLTMDGNHLAVYNRLAPTLDREKLHCFKLPLQVETLFEAAGKV